jgi:hypothetical protein
VASHTIITYERYMFIIHLQSTEVNFIDRPSLTIRWTVEKKCSLLCAEKKLSQMMIYLRYKRYKTIFTVVEE